MTKQKGVTVGEIVLLILLALALAVVAWRNEDWNEGVRMILMFGAIIFLALSIMAIILWMQYNQTVTAALSERVRYAMELRHLSPEQLAAIGKYVPAYEVISGTQGPVYLWRCMGGGLVTRTFIRSYIAQGSDAELYPVRNLGREEREEAMLLIEDWAQRGWCTLPAGNQPGKWINRTDAIRQIFGGEA